MDLARSRRECIEPPRDAIVEARADADHQVAVVHREIGLVGAVHAEHAEPLRVGRGIGAEPHQRRRDRETGRTDQFAQQLAGLPAGIDHAAAGVEHRPLRRSHQLDRGVDLVGVALELRLITLVLEFVRPRVKAGRELHVLGDVDHDRSGPAARGDVEGLVQHARQVGDVLHKGIVFGAGPGDADGVAFLECVIADEMGGHLPGDAHDRNGIAQRIGEAGDRVGRPRSRGHQHAADLAGRARIAFGGMDRPLFVAHQNMADAILLEQRVVDRQHGPAGIAEDMPDPLVLQGLDHHLGAGHFSCHCLTPSVRRAVFLE